MNKDKYYLYELAEITGKDERHILDLAENGLIFSMFVEYAHLELHQVERYVEEEINGHKSYGNDVIKQSFKEYEYEILDLFSLIPIRLARGKVEVNPYFNIEGWDRVIILSKGQERANKDNIFVKKSNLEEYSKTDAEFKKAFRLKSKTGPKTNKVEKIKQIFLDRLMAGLTTTEELSKENQESLTLDGDFKDISTNRGTIIKARNAAIKEFEKPCQN